METDVDSKFFVAITYQNPDLSDIASKIRDLEEPILGWNAGVCPWIY